MTDLSVIVCIAFDHLASAEGLARFKQCIFSCPFVDSALEVSGTYDLIVQGSCSSHAEYMEHMTLIRPQVAEFASRIETNFISLNVPCRPVPEEGGWLWLPCEGGSKRVDAHLIDKIAAEGDYMRVYVGDWSCLIHQTMHSLYAKLGTTSFIKLHRSSLVRIEFIERLVNVERRWEARLRDGTHVSVAKSHVQDVLRMIGGESSKGRVGLPKERSLTPTPGGVNENTMRLPA